MPAEELKKRWSNGEVTFGANVRSGLPFLAEALSISGFDYIKINMEHGMNWEETFLPVIQAIHGTGATPIVKVPKIDREFIGKVLDLGAEGIACPGIRTPEDAAYAVACTRHAPVGVRGSTSFYTKYLPGGRNRDLIVIAGIESAEGARNASKIAQVDGVSACTVGAMDLAQDLGLPHIEEHDHRSGPHQEAILSVFQACKEQGVPYGMMTDGDPSHLLPLGCQLISLGSDLAFFERGMKAALKSRPKGVNVK